MSDNLINAVSISTSRLLGVHNDSKDKEVVVIIKVTTKEIAS